MLRLCLWLALLAAIFVPLERRFALRPQKVWRREFGADLGDSFINRLLPAVLPGVPMALLGVAAQHLVPAALPATFSALPLAPKLALAFIVGETGLVLGPPPEPPDSVAVALSCGSSQRRADGLSRQHARPSGRQGGYAAVRSGAPLCGPGFGPVGLPIHPIIR